MGILGSSTSSSINLFSSFDGMTSLLEVGKSLRAPGIGLSSRARAITQQFLAESRAGTNIILSAGAQQTIDGMNQQIKALQARLPADKIGSYSARYDRSGLETSASTTGGKVDTQA